MLKIESYAIQFPQVFPELSQQMPWDIVKDASSIIEQKIATLSKDYVIQNSIAIHKLARIEEHVIIKSPAIISAGCFIGAHAYLRGGIYLGEGVSVGPGCEIKSSFVMSGSALAHFNFVGDSIVGSHVNMEAGSVIANHYNEREDKTIFVLVDSEVMRTKATKFGALVGDHSRIGANAVLSPGTILSVKAIVKRLELIDQLKRP
jgi:NDP-sugar pyrophosphorylase family protein